MRAGRLRETVHAERHERLVDLGDDARMGHEQ